MSSSSGSVLHISINHQGYQPIESDEELQNVVQELEATSFVKRFFTLNLGTRLARMRPEDLNVFLRKIVDSSPSVIDKVLSSLTTDMMIQAIQTDQNYETFVAIEQLIKRLSQCKSLVGRNINKLSAAYAPKKLNVLDTLLVAFSFFKREPNYSYEAMQMIQVGALIIAIPFIASSALDDLLTGHKPEKLDKLSLFASVVGLMFLTYIIMLVYQKQRKIPEQIKPLRNYSKEVAEGYIEPLLCRDDIIEKVFLCWQSANRDMRQHPLLVGPPGVGKTVIILEIAKRIASGEVPGSLKEIMKNMRVYGGPAVVLLPNQQGQDTDDKIERVLKMIEPHKNKTILVLDEIHILMNKDYGFRFGEILKSILDTGLRGLPYIIGATTDEEYSKYIAPDPSKARRFYVINVPPLSEEQTRFVVQQMVRRQYPEYEVIPEVIAEACIQGRALSEKFPRVIKEPEASKRLLSTAISRIQLKQNRPSIEDRLREERIALSNLQSTYVSSLRSPRNLHAIAEEITRVEESIVSDEHTLVQELENINRLRVISNKIVEIEEELIELCIKLDKKNNADDLTKVSFLYYYMLPILVMKRKDLLLECRLDDISVGTIRSVTKELDEDTSKFYNSAKDPA